MWKHMGPYGEGTSACTHCSFWGSFSSFSPPLSPLPSVRPPFPSLLLSFLLGKHFIKSCPCLSIKMRDRNQIRLPIHPGQKIRFNMPQYHSVIDFRGENSLKHPLQFYREIYRERATWHDVRKLEGWRAQDDSGWHDGEARPSGIFLYVHF